MPYYDQRTSAQAPIPDHPKYLRFDTICHAVAAESICCSKKRFAATDQIPCGYWGSGVLLQQLQQKPNIPKKSMVLWGIYPYIHILLLKYIGYSAATNTPKNLATLTPQRFSALHQNNLLQQVKSIIPYFQRFSAPICCSRKNLAATAPRQAHDFQRFPPSHRNAPAQIPLYVKLE